MRTIAETPEELLRLYRRAVRKGMSAEERDRIWYALEEEATDFAYMRHEREMERSRNVEATFALHSSLRRKRPK